MVGGPNQVARAAANAGSVSSPAHATWPSGRTSTAAGSRRRSPIPAPARLGARGEYTFTPTAPRTGAEAAAAGDFALEQLLHLYALNRGILLTPFHNMALMSPATTESDVDRHTDVFHELLATVTLVMAPLFIR